MEVPVSSAHDIWAPGLVLLCIIVFRDISVVSRVQGFSRGMKNCALY